MGAACTPEVLFKEVFHTFDELVGDEQSLAWVDQGSVTMPAGQSIVRMAKAGGKPQPVAGPYKKASSPALFPGGTVHVGDGVLYRTPIGGTPVVVPVDGTDPVVSTAANATHVFWATDKALFRAKVDGSERVTLASDLSAGGPLRLTADHLYWREMGTALIRRVPLVGGAAENVTKGADKSSPWYAAGGGRVFYGALTAKMLLSESASGGDVQTLVPDVLANAMFSQSGCLYWVNLTNGVSPASLEVVPETGGASRTVATGAFVGASLSVDASYVYMIADLSTVVRVKR